MDLTTNQLAALLFAVETPDITVLDRVDTFMLHGNSRIRGSGRKSEINVSNMDEEIFKKHFRMTRSK